MSRTGIGGPNTPEGKRRSSLNAIRHGGCANHCILPEESAQDFENLRQNWFESFNPIGFGESKAVDELAEADWLFQRNKRRLHQTEYLLSREVDDGNVTLHAFDWDDDQHKRLQLLTRYKTNSERSYQRALAVCQQMRAFNMACADKVRRVREQAEKRFERAAQAEQRAQQAEEKRLRAEEKVREAEEAKTRAAEEKIKQAEEAEANLTIAQRTFKGQRNKKKLKDQKPVTLEQWVEVRQNEAGEVTTTLYPDNAGLIKRGQSFWPAPTIVYRRFFFIGPIPLVYDWTVADLDNADSLRASGGTFIQRMSIDDWFVVTEEEKEWGTGHLLPTNHLPRPESRGECDCQACEVYRKRLEEQEKDQNENQED